MTALCILIAIGLNYAVGVFVLTGVLDGAERRWSDWVERCPVPGGFFVIISAWPVLLWLWWRDARGGAS